MDRKILLGIIILGFILRVSWLATIPFGFTPDEASFGYDAYSILKTGKDQWGHPIPLVLESFGDFKSPLYSYITIPSVAIFGLTKFATRLPNAILGTLSIYITYLLAFKLAKSFDNNELSERKRYLYAYACTLLMAINPWHIMMSRGAFEANLTTFLLPLGIYFFYKGLEKPKYFQYSALVFGLNLFTYHAAKIVTPIVFLSLIIASLAKVRKMKVREIVGPISILIFFLAIFSYTLFLGSSTRALNISIFRGSLGASSSERLNDVLAGMPDIFARILHNKYQVSIRRFANNYMQYFSTTFLFSQGPSEGTYGMIPGRGLFYWFEIPFFIGALVFLSQKKILKVLLPILTWLFIAPFPAALSLGPGYHANRAVIMLPAIQIFLGLGVLKCLDILKSPYLKKLKRLTLMVFLTVSVYLVLMFLDDYFIQSPYKTAKDMNYGNLEFSYLLSEGTPDSENIIVSTNISEPHIYVAFANKWEPKLFQDSTESWNYQELELGWLDQMPEYKLGNYTFRKINWPIESKDSILVGKPDDFPLDLKPNVTIDYPDAKSAIYIVFPQKANYAQKIF